MSELVNQRLNARRVPDLAAPGVSDVFVGKDLLELLSTGMYVDPMSIYR